MKKKIINGILAAAILIAAPSAFVSCKDNDADLRTELLGKIADLRDQLDKIEKQVGPQGPAGQDGKNGKDGKDGSVVTIGDNGNWFIDGVDTKVPAKGEKGDPGEQGKPGENGTIGSVITIGDNGNWFIDGKDTGVPAKGEKGDTGAPGQDGTIGSKVTIGENGNWFIDGEDTNVPATGPAGENGKDGSHVALIKGVDGHWYWWIDGKPTGVQADGNAVTVNGSTMEVKNGTWWIDGTDTGVLAYTYNEMVKLIKDQIYNAERDGLTPELEAIIKKLLENLENSVVKSIKNMVTDIIAERTENSVYGQLDIPGWNPLILAAYYGSVGTDVTFPQDEINIKGVSPFTLDAGEEIKGDGGKVYLTLNPSEVGIDGKIVSLETSQGKEGPFTLEDLKESDAELTFGWNRTRSTTGLYEATAKLKTAASAGINIDSELLKNDAQEILDNIRKGSNKRNAVKSLSTLVADIFTDAVETVPAYSVKMTWGDPIFGTRTVRSGYDIAAFSVKPLSYTHEYTLVNNDAQPYVDNIQAFINRLIDRVNIEFHANLDVPLSRLQIKKIEEVGNTQVELTVGFVTYTDNTYTTVNGQTKEYKLKIGHDDGTELTVVGLDNQIYTTFKDIIEYCNGELDRVNHLLDQVQGLDANIAAQIDQNKENLKSLAQDYLSTLVYKINAELQAFSVNRILQPTLLMKDRDGIRRASGEVKAGEEVSLLPTSYTAELLAPAYKKFVSVIAVNGAAAGSADNPGNLGEVLDGGVQEVKFTPKAGESYTIAYSAMDYFGNIVTNYYIVTGK